MRRDVGSLMQDIGSSMLDFSIYVYYAGSNEVLEWWSIGFDFS
jgi:hypothetical protein